MRRHQFLIRVAAIGLVLFLAVAPYADYVHEAIPHSHPGDESSSWDGVGGSRPSPLMPPPRSAHAAPASQMAPLTTGPFPTGTDTFLETFDDFVDPGNPPVDWKSNAKWDILTHSRDNHKGLSTTWGFLQPMLGTNHEAIHHGDNCESPDYNSSDPTHEGGYDAGNWGGEGTVIGTMPYNMANFLCRDHMMTALKAEGYGLTYSTPTRLLQIPADGSEAIVRLDISTFRASSRDWIDIWLTPWVDNLPAPFNLGQVDLQGSPKNAFIFKMGSFAEKSQFGTWRAQNFVEGPDLSAWWVSYEDEFVARGMGCVPQTPTCTNTSKGTSKSRRDTFEIRLSRTHVKFWMPDYNQVWLDQDLTTPLEADQFVVQFGHHSYNPKKAYGDFGELDEDGWPAHANTWHWDNFYLSPATQQFTNIPANERALGTIVGGHTLPPGADTFVGDTYTFPQAAPANSYFRGLIKGTGLEHRTNGGAWTTTPIQPANRAAESDGVHKNYFFPIPEGTTSIQFRETVVHTNGFWGANHGAIWSLTPSDAVPPTPTPTNTPVVANTPTNTPTPTNTQTPTATATSTNTPIPTNTPAPDTTTLFDDFDDNVFDSAKWVAGNIYSASSDGMTMAETSQEVRITPADGVAPRYYGYRSLNNYNLTSRDAYIHVKQVASGADLTGIETVFIVGPNASNWIRMVVNNGQLYCQSDTADSTTIHASAAYSTSLHAWWRLRESGGMLYCDVAPNNDGAPGVWQTFGSRSLPSWSLTGIKIEFHVGTWQSTTSPVPARFDGFNTSDGADAPGHRRRRGNLTGVE